MAEEDGATTNNKNKLIAIICGAVLVIVAVVLAVIFMNKGEVLDDNFFKTSDSKIVMTTTSDSTDPTVAKKVHQVYTIDGDKITGLKVYSEFESEQAAKDADAKPEVQEAMSTGVYKDHKVQGKFIIITMKDEVYQSLTVEQLKATAEALESAIQSGVDQQTEETESIEDTDSTTTEENVVESSEESEE